VIDFYLSYRAWVRGKVAAFLATDPSTSLDARAAERDKARRLFGLARSFSGVAVDRPFLLAVGGVIGSGKSTLAAALGRELAVPVISSDRARKAAAGIAATARADASLYDRESRDSTYVEIVRSAAGVLGSGRGAILDATFSEQRWRELAAEAARARNADFVFIEATCADRDRLRQRLAGRRQSGSVSDATEQLLDSFLRDFQPISASDLGSRFSVDTGGTPEAAVAEAIRKLTASRILPAAARRAS